MLALMQPAAVQELAREPGDFGVDRTRMVDCQNDNSVMAQMLHYAAGVMLVPLLPRWPTPSPYEVLEGTTASEHPAVTPGPGAQR